MKHIKMRKLLAVLLTTLLFAAFSASVYADAIDLNETGSISVTFKDSATGQVIGDGVMTLYKVADIESSDGNLAYVYTEGFAGSEIVLGDLTAETLAGDLHTYAKNNSVNAAKIGTVNNMGICYFDELELGLYLVVQTAAAEGYHIIAPFLVSVPISTTAGWVYDVEATPKMEKGLSNYTSSSVTTSSTTTPPTSTTRDPSDVYGAQNQLPQTGQLNWPIPVLAGGGILLFLIGWVAVNGKGKKESR